MPQLLYGRLVTVEVGQAGQIGRAWSDLRVVFSVDRSVGRTPGKARIDVYNLTRDSSAAFQADGAVVRLLAGYETPVSIFLGDVDRAIRAHAGTEAVTTVEATDGGRKYREARIARTFDAETTAVQVLDELAAAAGLPIGYLGPLPDVRITQGITLVGPVRDQLDRVVASLGAEWSIQDGDLQVITAAQALPEAAVLLSPGTGLVGSPVANKDGIELTALLQPSITPGRRFQLRSRLHSGIYRAERVEHTGDTHGQDFYTRIVAKEAS